MKYMVSDTIAYIFAYLFVVFALSEIFYIIKIFSVDKYKIYMKKEGETEKQQLFPNEAKFAIAIGAISGLGLVLILLFTRTWSPTPKPERRLSAGNVGVKGELAPESMQLLKTNLHFGPKN